MYIINTTYAVPERITEEWKKWASEVLFPSIIRTEKLTNPRMYRVMVKSENGDKSFCVQYDAELEGVRLWEKELNDQTQRLVKGKFGTLVLGFSTILKEVKG